jgi:hypothetical protein
MSVGIVKRDRAVSRRGGGICVKKSCGVWGGSCAKIMTWIEYALGDVPKFSRQRPLSGHTLPLYFTRLSFTFKTKSLGANRRLQNHVVHLSTERSNGRGRTSHSPMPLAMEELVLLTRVTVDGQTAKLQAYTSLFMGPNSRRHIHSESS